MRRLCPWCRWWWFLPAALALSLLGMIGGCGLVENDLTSRTKSALTGNGLANIGVDYDYRSAVLRGPESARQAALSAALGLNGVREARYVATASGTPAASASVDLTATWNGEQTILRGQVATQEQHDQLVAAIRLVASGRRYISPDLAEELAKSIRDGSEKRPHELLSDREFYTLRMLASGKSLIEIAESLSISPKTVSVYRTRLLEKMKLKNNAEIAHYAIKNGLID